MKIKNKKLEKRNRNGYTTNASTSEGHIGDRRGLSDSQARIYFRAQYYYWALDGRVNGRCGEGSREEEIPIETTLRSSDPMTRTVSKGGVGIGNMRIFPRKPLRHMRVGGGWDIIEDRTPINRGQPIGAMGRQDQQGMMRQTTLHQWNNTIRNTVTDARPDRKSVVHP